MGYEPRRDNSSSLPEKRVMQRIATRLALTASLAALIV